MADRSIFCLLPLFIMRAMLTQIIFNGLIAGSAYSLIALGYTMIYGVGRLINFAHGELYMGAAYCFFLFYIQLDWNIYSSFFGAILIGALLGIALERIAYRPFKESSRLIPLITTIGASTFLKAVAILFFGVQAKTLLKYAYFQPSFDFLGATLTPVQGYTLISSLGLMALLALVLKRTRFGKAIRATAEDRISASHLGIDTDEVTSITFAIGGLLAAVAGILVGYDQNITPTMGILAGFKGFTAAVLGGIGNIPGAVIGGFCIGLAENLGAAYLSSANKDSISFAILLLILLFKPSGILGKK
ncbi:MAG: branched-chain amino acid ABC transporter permease [Deltaproteobacteria bacterium]|nr:branched-chain amino acid ABC transporter permease [Deltaproteobacteria bacterium]MBM4321942.1 branched-chain amino acid ABC transporter permease [Deltaproteobacteria bacterium]